MARKVLNGAANCILEVCCAPAADGSASMNAQRWLATLFQGGTDCGLTEEQAGECAAFIYLNFDLAARGTLAPFKASIVRVFKEGTPTT